MYIDLSLKVERKRLEEFVGLFKHSGGITEQDVMESFTNTAILALILM